MTALLHELIEHSAARTPAAPAITFRQATLSYAELQALLERVAAGVLQAGVERQGRVAIYLPKRPETVAGFFGATRAGWVFVPVNPLLKPPQVGHILRDCAVRLLITTAQRAAELQAELAQCSELRTLVILDGELPEADTLPGKAMLKWDAFIAAPPTPPHRIIDADIAAILYTSGSTGKPKGVVLSHKNMMTGAKSVAQ